MVCSGNVTLYPRHRIHTQTDEYFKSQDFLWSEVSWTVWLVYRISAWEIFKIKHWEWYILLLQNCTKSALSSADVLPVGWGWGEEIKGAPPPRAPDFLIPRFLAVSPLKEALRRRERNLYLVASCLSVSSPRNRPWERDASNFPFSPVFLPTAAAYVRNSWIPELFRIL